VARTSDHARHPIRRDRIGEHGRTDRGDTRRGARKESSRAPRWIKSAVTRTDLSIQSVATVRKNLTESSDAFVVSTRLNERPFTKPGFANVAPRLPLPRRATSSCTSACGVRANPRATIVVFQRNRNVSESVP